MTAKRTSFFLVFITVLLWLGTPPVCVFSENVPENMVVVKGGTFIMGSKEDPSKDEAPVHDVTLDSFLIGKFEVTQQQWQAVMGANPSLFKGDNLPVEQVTWYDAVAYCNKRSESEGLTPCYSGSGDEITCDFTAAGYRLPTEAEWEYACRGGDKTRNYLYSGSNDPGEAAWYERNSGLKAQPVGQKIPNELGIYDMSGNIWEWCWDWYDSNYYQQSPIDNPQGPGPARKRSYRGGGFGGREDWLRCTARYSLPPAYLRFDMGIRVVKKAGDKVPADMVLVQGGKFRMGNDEGGSDHITLHQVTIDTFYMAKFEVTQQEWLEIMGYNPSLFPGLICPVHSVDWQRAVEYCNKRSLKEGLTPCYSGSGDQIACNFDANGYRLPTEAEWEYASRGGALSQNFLYSGSNNAGEVGWFQKNVGFQIQPVGQKKPNELGIYDMSGNAWEWCWDLYRFDYYKISPSTNPTGPDDGIRRVIRGGGAFSPEPALSCTNRSRNNPYTVLFDYGFRVVRTANPRLNTHDK